MEHLGSGSQKAVEACWAQPGPEAENGSLDTGPQLSALPLLLPQDPACSAGFHPSGSVLAVGTVTGR